MSSIRRPRRSREETRDLAIEDGFICRSAYEENKSRADNTQHVGLGDIIHVYFSGEGGPKTIGTFEVVGPRRHPFPERFGKGVDGTALHAVTDDFARKLGAAGDVTAERYEPDPVLKKLAGWFVVRRSDVPTPPFDSAPFTSQACLVR